MWIRISKIDLEQLNAEHLVNPKNENNPMTLILYQQESRTAFFVSTYKKVLAEYLEAPTGRVIARRRWTPEMKVFAEQELAKISPREGGFRITIVGWIFILLVLGFFAYLGYDSAQAPAREAAYQERMTEAATVEGGDIYFGRYRIYEEKGNMIGSDGGFGWFKVVSIDGDTYHIAKSTDISKTAKPKEEMNNDDFEEETHAVKGKEISAYYKHFISDDGLVEFTFDAKKE